jgi:hypothetical protein
VIADVRRIAVLVFSDVPAADGLYAGSNDALEVTLACYSWWYSALVGVWELAPLAEFGDVDALSVDARVSPSPHPWAPELPVAALSSHE